MIYWLFWVLICCAGVCHGATPDSTTGFPPLLSSYQEQPDATLAEALRARIVSEPFNLIASIIFLLAILHTFMAPTFMRWAHRVEAAHRARLGNRPKGPGGKEPVSFRAEMLHFLGEVEAIFGIWILPLFIIIIAGKGWATATHYLERNVSFTEPIFVVVIMAIAASRPIVNLAERLMSLLAGLGGGRPAAWWLAILTLGPVLGSFITEPGAMTISALLLAEKIYERRPPTALAYATLGLLFVNISVGGTLTHFAAPPVLMVAGKWGWGMTDMLTQFGWKALAGLLVSNLAFFAWFRRDLNALGPAKPPLDVEMIRSTGKNDEPVPVWITLVHLLFLIWTVVNNHYPVLFVGGFLFYLAFTEATQHHQFDLELRSPLLVGFFLAGLVVHGGLQGWWIEPVLRRLTEVPLYFGAVFLTSFNDNAAITYLASLVPDFSAGMKYAVVAGAVAGGGLTVIANAPNPAGQSILAKYFPDGVSPLYLFLGALLPTTIISAFFLAFR